MTPRKIKEQCFLKISFKNETFVYSFEISLEAIENKLSYLMTKRRLLDRKEVVKWPQDSSNMECQPKISV